MSHLDQLDMHDLGILFYNGLVDLQESHSVGSYDYKVLGIIRYKLRILGALPPLMFESKESTSDPFDTDPMPLSKDQLLTLAGQLQMHSTDHRHNNGRREEFRQIARLLRHYLYDNYQLSPNIVPKKGRPRKVSAEVQNAVSD